MSIFILHIGLVQCKIKVIQIGEAKRGYCWYKLQSMPVIPAFSRLRQEEPKFKASLGYIGRPCLNKERNVVTLTELFVKKTTHLSLNFITELHYAKIYFMIIQVFILKIKLQGLEM